MYFSRKLNSAQQNYSTFDCELLVIYLSIQHFRYFTEGCDCFIVTDHKPLTYALRSRSSNRSPHQAQQLDYISQFTSDVHHLPGSANGVADILSRLDVAALSLPSPIDLHTLAKAQWDEEIATAVKDTSLVLQLVAIPATDFTLLCDMATGVPCPYVPEKLQHQLCTQLHGLSHPGIHATQQLVTSKYVWPNMNTDIRQWTRASLACQQSNVHLHTTSPTGHFRSHDSRFAHVHVDLVGPLPSVHCYTYLLMCVDHFTCWPEESPLASSTTETVAQAFLSGWVARFGAPSSLTSDRGAQFESALWQ